MRLKCSPQTRSASMRRDDNGCLRTLIPGNNYPLHRAMNRRTLAQNRSQAENRSRHRLRGGHVWIMRHTVGVGFHLDLPP